MRDDFYNSNQSLRTRNLARKVDLAPLNNYEDQIETIEELKQEEYSQPKELQKLHPRTFHEIFRTTYMERKEPSARLHEQYLDDIEEALTENSENEANIFSEKLFNLGYRMGRNVPPKNLVDTIDMPQSNHIPEEIESPYIWNNSYTEGKNKAVADNYYRFAASRLAKEVEDWDIEVI